jgi:AraC-like DNA-binding protein/quercetin dioxygenase-like cupin family protein
MNENYVKQGYLLEDFRLFHLKGAAGIKTEYHYHEFCKLLILVSGSGSYWIEGQRYALQPGDAVLVGSGCVHRPEFEPGTPYERIIVYISPEFLKRESAEDCDLLECFNGQKSHVLRPGKGDRRLITLAQELERQLSGAEYGRVILSRGLLLRLLIQIGRDMNRGDALQPQPLLPQDSRVLRIMEYIDKHLTEDLSVDMIAEQFYVSKFHMMRLFRAATGISVNGYIIRQRLLLARELIGSGMSATESCFRAGFGSYSSFTRCYGSYFGATPTGRKYTARLLEESYE